MSSQTLTLTVRAEDQATGTLERVGTSARQLITGFSGVATSAFNLYNAYDRVADMQVSVDRANLTAKSTLNTLEDSQKKYSKAVADFGEDSEKAKSALADLKIAQERHDVAVERAEMIQGNLNETMIQSAISVVPTAITMVDNLTRIYKNIPDLSGVLGKVSSSIGQTGSVAATAAISVGAFMGGFLIADTLFKSIPENMRGVVGALTAAIAAIVAATIAWMAFHGTMTVGVAVPIILAAVGAGIAGIKAAVGMAEGAYVTEPTAAILGEAGEPEIVAPESKLREIVGESRMDVTIHSTVNIYGNIGGGVSLEQVHETVNQGLGDAINNYLASRYVRRQ